jgi:hypothetical protein
MPAALTIVLAPAPCRCAEAARTKLGVAKDVIKGMLDRLAPDDCGAFFSAAVQLCCIFV